MTEQMLSTSDQKSGNKLLSMPQEAFNSSQPNPSSWQA